MKKIWISLLLVALLLGTAVSCAPAVTPVAGLVYESFGDGTCRLVSGTGSNAYELTVPTHSPAGDRVVAIGEGAFRGAENLTAITLPEGVERVEKDAFRDCQSLLSVSFPSTLKELGDGAFYGCGRLFGVRLPKGMEKIGRGVFAYCTAITMFSIDEGGTHFENGANCIIRKADRTVVAGSSRAVLIGDVLHIAPDAFRGMALSESFTVPVGVLSIGEGAFFGVSTVKKIFLPASVTEIGAGAFGDNAALVSFTVAPSNTVFRSEGNAILTKDGKTLLFGCNATVIPEGVSEIGAGAFASMKRLTSVTLPASVEKIGAGAFRDCAFLAEFKVDRTEDGFAAVEKGEGWNAGCSFTVTYAEALVEN